jgi:hypothetical protein
MSIVFCLVAFVTSLENTIFIVTSDFMYFMTSFLLPEDTYRRKILDWEPYLKGGLF